MADPLPARGAAPEPVAGFDPFEGLGPARHLASLWRRAEAHPALAVGLFMAAVTVATWAPFLDTPDLLFGYRDGPFYAYVAKTFYAIPADQPFAAHGLPASYFACHLPGYPALIRLLAPLAGGNLLWGMLLATLVSAVAAAVLFHRLLAERGWVASPLWTALLFALLPPRWLVYHAVGATEPLFFCWIFLAFLAFYRGRPAWVTLAVLLASLTRITGVLLGPLFFGLYLWRREWRAAALVPLSALGLLALFGLYQLRFGDFFAYFTWNLAGEALLRWPPLAVLQEQAAAGDFQAAELTVLNVALYGAGVVALRRRPELLAFGLVYLGFTLCVFHPDLSRYLLPLAPFALLVGFDPWLRTRGFRMLLPLLLVPLFLYAWTLLGTNQLPRFEEVRATLSRVDAP